jgi:hypothetical protein
VADENEFTMTRRACLFGMLLAPFTRTLAVEPPSGAEFILQYEGFEWVIRLTVDGRVEQVLFDGQPMTSLLINRSFLTDRSGWHTFTHYTQQQSSQIKFRLTDDRTIEVDSLYATSQIRS